MNELSVRQKTDNERDLSQCNGESGVAATDSSRRVVDGLGRVLAAVPSLRSASMVWRKLGFKVGADSYFDSCPSFNVELNGLPLSFVNPLAAKGSPRLAAAAEDKLNGGAGLLGWTWRCNDTSRTARIIETLSRTRLPETETRAADSDSLLLLPPALTPGACTLLETVDSCTAALPTAGNKHGDRAAIDHPNRVSGIDHLVIVAGDVEKVAGAYEMNFSLKTQRRCIEDRRHCYMKVGSVVLEVVGPAQPAPRREANALWGLALRSDELDATVEFLRGNRVSMEDPHEAVQGGRIVGLPLPLGGIQIAFIGD